MFTPFIYALKSEPEKSVEPVAPRYVIMATTTLPAGKAFAPAESQQHLLAQFALGGLSVQDILEYMARPQ